MEGIIPRNVFIAGEFTIQSDVSIADNVIIANTLMSA
jgi:hypothetical protein